jgi:hypothetical protein
VNVNGIVHHPIHFCGFAGEDANGVGRAHLQIHWDSGLKTSSLQPKAYFRMREISSWMLRLRPSLKSGPVYVM